MTESTATGTSLYFVVRLCVVHVACLCACVCLSPPGERRVGAVFQLDNLTAYTDTFRRALERADGGRPARVRLTGDVVQVAAAAVHPDLMARVCDVIRRHNVSVFLAFGGQDLMNALSVVTSYLGIPVLGYNTDRNVAALRVGRFHFRSQSCRFDVRRQRSVCPPTSSPRYDILC